MLAGSRLAISGGTVAFDMLASPFARLDVSNRATRAELVSAHQRAVLDGEFEEEDLDRALSALTVPRERLRAEVAFLPGSTPAQARAITARLKARDFGGSWGGGWDEVNVLAHMLAHGGATDLVFALLINSHTPDIAGIENSINAVRKVSGFPQVAPGAVAEEVATLLSAHAATAAARLAEVEEDAESATALVEIGLKDNQLNPFLSAFIQAFGRHTGPRLAKLASDIDVAAAVLRDEHTVANAAAVAACLHRWDAVRQPIQLWDEAQGIDEPESRALGYKLRDLCIELANEHSAYDAALVLSRALHEAFGELPGMRDQFAQDIGKLGDLADQARVAETIASVTKVLAAMAARPAMVANNLDHFVGSMVPYVRGELRTAFETALEQLDDDDAGVLALEIRGLTLDLHNEHKMSDTALRLTEWLLTYRQRLPHAITSKLLEDQANLQRMVRHTEEQRTSTTGKRWGWGLAAAFVAFLIYSNNVSKTPDYSNNETTTTTTEWDAPAADAMATAPASDAMEAAPDVDAMAAPAADAMAAPADDETASVTATDMTETQPAALIGQSLNRAELRYCLRQKERLNAASSAVNNRVERQVDGFNAAVDDYNGRCGQFRYMESDMSAVTDEISADTFKLLNEGRAMVESW